MDFIKNWALGLVVASIVGTVVLILTPNGSVEKQVKTAVSLFLLVAFVQPFLSWVDLNSIFDREDIVINNEENVDLNKSVSEQMKLELKGRIDEIIDGIGIKAEGINIDIIINENNEMQIQEVTVVVDKSHLSHKNEIEEQIKEKLGIIAEVEVG